MVEVPLGGFAKLAKDATFFALPLPGDHGWCLTGLEVETEIARDGGVWPWGDRT